MSTMSTPENKSTRSSIHTSGIKKSFLTPCRRIGLSRIYKAPRSIETLLNSPIIVQNTQLNQVKTPVNLEKSVSNRNSIEKGTERTKSVANSAIGSAEENKLEPFIGFTDGCINKTNKIGTDKPIKEKRGRKAKTKPTVDDLNSDNHILINKEDKLKINNLNKQNNVKSKKKTLLECSSSDEDLKTLRERISNKDKKETSTNFVERKTTSKSSSSVKENIITKEDKKNKSNIQVGKEAKEVPVNLNFPLKTLKEPITIKVDNKKQTIKSSAVNILNIIVDKTIKIKDQDQFIDTENVNDQEIHICNNSSKNLINSKNRVKRKLSLKKSTSSKNIISDDDEDFVIKPKIKARRKLLSSNENSSGSLVPDCIIKIEKFSSVLENLKVVSSNSLISNEDMEILNSPKSNEEIEIDSLRNKLFDLSAKVEEKERQVADLKQAVVYKKLHNVKELKELQEVWKMGCQEALRALYVKLNENCLISMSSLMKKLNIPPEMFTYNVENDCFV